MEELVGELSEEGNGGKSARKRDARLVPNPCHIPSLTVLRLIRIRSASNRAYYTTVLDCTTEVWLEINSHDLSIYSYLS